MPAGHKDTKHIPNHSGASGNLPKIGVGAPGVYTGGTRPTSKPNSTGGVFVPKQSAGQSAGQAARSPSGNSYSAPPNPY